MNRLVLSLAVLCAFTTSAHADAVVSYWQKFYQDMVTERIDTYARFVNDAADAAGVERPMLYLNEEVDFAEKAKYRTLVRPEDEEIVWWAIQFNPASFLQLTDTRLRFMARIAICHKEKNYLNNPVGWYELGVLAKCAYHKYPDAEFAEYVAIFRIDQSEQLIAHGYEENCSEEDIRTLLRALYGDPSLANWRDTR